MQQNTLDRVREDLATMNAAMGGLPFGSADVRAYVALAVASGVFAVSHALGADRGWPLFLSGLPVILAFMAYLGYLAVRSRRRSPVDITRRKEYRKTLLILLPVALAALAGRYWAARAGMSHLQFGGAILVVTGCVFAIIAMTSPWPARYPRSYWLAAGLPLIASGLWVPFCTRTQALSAAGCMAVALFGLLAIVMHYHLRRQDERVSNAAD
ncbi:MAG: hypothetical protein ACYSVY_19945 [Planctomycetota bacterium]|jgi:hypothetical protein